MSFDFDFLRGDFAVAASRLKDPFDADSGWVDMPATASAITLFDGAVSLDEMWFPGDERYGMSLRLWNPVKRSWTVRWLSSAGDGLQPPVEGVWADGRCRLVGPDDYRGRAVLASYSWSDVSDAGGRWEQCFSTDDGRSWQRNFVMRFTRQDTPVRHPRLPRVSDDFDFLTGSWQVRHRRLLDPVRHALGGQSPVVEFDGRQHGRTYFAGAVSVDELTLAEPGQYGLTFRVRDPRTGQWSIHWVNSRAGTLEPPVHGGFADGVGTFYGREPLGGHDVQVRFIWSDITATTARWEQAFRIADGDWDTNWEMTLTRSQEQQ